MSMIANEAQDKTYNTFIDRTYERPKGCIILENAYKINVTFRPQPIQFSTVLHIEDRSGIGK
jgi:hypothetical protein